MSNVLQVDSNGDNFAWKDLPSTYSDVYVSYEVYYPAAVIVGFPGHSMDFTAFGDPYTTGVILDGLMDDPTSSPAGWYLASGQHITTADAGGDAWHTVIVRYRELLNYPAATIDGTSYTPGSGVNHGDDVEGVLFGAWGGSSTGVFYMRNLKVGTTPGGGEIFDEDLSGGDLSNFTSTQGSVSVIADPTSGPPSPPPPPESHALVLKLYDLASTELADISLIALEKSMKRRLNQARSFTVTVPAGHHLVTDIAGDGYPNLRKGNRKLLVWEDGTIIFHGRVWTVERNGDGKQNLATLTAFDPFMELGYDSDDRAGRPVRDATGNFVDPSFTGTGSGGASVLSGPDLIRQVLQNSVSNSGAAGDMEGALPIDTTTGTFDVDVPPAVDLSVIDTMDWPVLIGDFVNQLVESNVVDVDMRPVDPTEGFDPYVMVALSAVSSQGTDLSGTVHFDYWTGSRNAMACRHVEDFTTICNKLYDYLGPRRDIEHWRANITPGSPGTTVDPSASRTLYGGEFMTIRIFDSVGSESSSRPLYIALWNAEQGLRVEPRNLLFITPNPGAKALFEPPASFDVGDQIAINVGGDFGVTLAETQRVYGYDKTWDRQGIARISELLTSADVT